jgi:Kdo2-lipid IVA lauroyltransferase/acyltransferase
MDSAERPPLSPGLFRPAQPPGGRRENTHPVAAWLGRRARQLRYLFEAALFDVLSAVVRLASPRVRLALGSALGTVVWALDFRHRRVGRDNVRLAYGHAISHREVRRIVLGSMRHFARLAIETLAFSRYATEPDELRMRVEGFETVLAAHARGKGVLGFSGHLGNWELLMFTAGRLGVPAAGIARPLDNPYLESRLARLRTMSGNRVFAKHGAVFAAAEVLEAGGLVTLLIDQRPKQAGIAVRFFGHDAYTTEMLAVLALRTGAAIVPAFALLEADGSWRVVIDPEVPVVRSGDRRADLYRITADCTAILEQWIRRYPEQWLWTHRRWKVPGKTSGGPSGAHAPDGLKTGDRPLDGGVSGAQG